MYLFMKKNPVNSHNIMEHANEFIKYMPISRQSADMLTPFFDMTNNRALFSQEGGDAGGGGDDAGWTTRRQQNSVNKIMTSGKTGGGGNGPTKRSVSESKKKFVAAQQGWKCGDCQRQLPGWF